MVTGAVIGGLISALISDSLATSVGCQAHVSFFGGFIMTVGARFASGCTRYRTLSRSFLRRFSPDVSAFLSDCLTSPLLSISKH